jgi:Uncharacterized conserved protein
MSAIKVLVVEHDYILKMIEVTKHILEAEDSSSIHLEHVENIIDFIKNFADKYHHLKEEDILFIEMEKYGMSRENGPIGVMLYEHNEGRGFIKQAEEGLEQLKKGDSSAFAQVQENLLNYCNLLTNHIGKENNILYPMAERLLPESALGDMKERFENINISTLQNEYHDKYIKMVEEYGRIYLNV